MNGSGGIAARGTAPVKVNYVNALTGKKIPGMDSATIKANVNDIVTVDKSSSSASGVQGTYTYAAPKAPNGYKEFASANKVTVANVNAGEDNPNVINVAYTPNDVKGSVYQAFEKGTPGSTTVTQSILNQLGGHDFTNFPTDLGWGGTSNIGGTKVPGTADSSVNTNEGSEILSGQTDSPIKYPAIKIPAGYTIGHIYYQKSDGTWQTYTASEGTDGSALYTQVQNDHPNFDATYNSIVVAYQPINWSANFKAVYSEGTPGVDGNSGKAPNDGWKDTIIKGLQGAFFVGQTDGPTTPTYKADTGFTYNVTSTDGSKNYTYSNLADAVAHWTMFNSDTNFNINIQADKQSGKVTYQYVDKTPGTDDNGQPSDNPTTLGQAADLPSNVNLTGLTNGTVNITKANIPTGYSIDHVVAPDGKTYDTVADAQNADDMNAYFNTKENDWKIYLKADQNNPTLQADFTAVGSGVTVPETVKINFQDADGNQWQGATGAPIPADVIKATEQKMNDILSDAQYASWILRHYADPNGNFNTDDLTLAAIVKDAGGNVLGDSNAYVAQYDYSGTLSMSAPDTINFGTSKVTGTLQKLTGKLNQGVTISDTRMGDNLKPYTISVAQSSPIQDTNGSFDGYMTFNGSTLS